MRGIISSSAAEDATFQSQYKINDRTVSWDAYTIKLKSIGILVKARNFLVFQASLSGIILPPGPHIPLLFQHIAIPRYLRS